MPSLRQGFPGRSSFREEAKIYAGSFSFEVHVDVVIDFYDKINVSVEVFKKTDSRKIEEGSFETLDFISQFENETKIIIPGRLIIFGFFASIQTRIDNSRNRVETGIFLAYKVISLEFPGYVRLQDNSVKHFLTGRHDEDTSFVRLKIYLSDEFSFRDRYVISEGSNVDKDNASPSIPPKIFCLLNSGHLFRCGKSWKKFFSAKTVGVDQKNIYKFSFFDLKISSKCLDRDIETGSEDNNNTSDCSEVLKELELTSMRLCDYLSIIAGRIIEPVYYEYEVSISGRSMTGLMLPVFEHVRLNTNANHWPEQDLKSPDLSLTLEAFLECCPLEDRIGRGLFNLRSSLSKDYSSDLKVLAICSSIEYFFAHWFWKMEGYDFLTNHQSTTSKKRKSLERSYTDGKTPAISTYLQPFLDNLGVSYNHEETLELLKFRHRILHGGLFSESPEFLGTIHRGRDLAAKIMNSILKIISKSDNIDIYDQIEAVALTSSYLNSSHWLDVESARHELVDFESSGILGQYWLI